MRAKGLAYERKVAKALCEMYAERGEVLVGQWFELEDRDGHTWLQPDAIIVPSDPALPLVLVETKLSLRAEAADKLRRVYAPVAKHVWPARALRLVQICHNLPLGHNLTLTPISALLEGPYKDGYFLVHHCV
jgi:hypothetical protein